jgi:nitrilase
LKYNTYFQGEQIHVAAWPNLFRVVGDMPFFNSVEACRMASHVYAIEGAAFVLLASQVQTEKGLRANGLSSLKLQDEADAPHTAVIGGGFSEIIAPDGRTLVKATDDTWEGLLYHVLDFNEIYVAKSTVDVVGHYSRPDIFRLQVNGQVHRQVVAGSVDSEFCHESRFQQLDNEY